MRGAVTEVVALSRPRFARGKGYLLGLRVGPHLCGPVCGPVKGVCAAP